ncbi:MAG: ECF transporter S component [Veillonella sp.]|uniref:ECF transporter S component n=1 Tax=Veillonella sp. TaxID=1926307 RepID=UPI0025D66EB2|nr:ECF transporter S component [Veillonella sp.]MBS4913536.1 ECF transporter S component [Veillonella sp.]
MKFSIRDIVYIGMLSAIMVLATFIFVPLPAGAMAHLGSAALFTISSLFGGVYGGLSAALGSAIFDMLSGNYVYTVYSIIIKGLCGLMVGYMVIGLWPNRQKLREVSMGRVFMAIIVGAIWTAAGYFVAWANVLNSYDMAIVRLPASFITSGVGLLIAMFLIPALRNIRK